jgi:hypothetical protein
VVLTQNYCGSCLDELEQTTKTSVRIAGVSTEIHSKHFPKKFRILSLHQPIWFNFFLVLSDFLFATIPCTVDVKHI